LALNAYSFATLRPEATRAFDRYIALAENVMTHDLEAARFLRVDGNADEKIKLRSGEVRIEAGPRAGDLRSTGALIQDWIGTVFIPNANIRQVKAVLQDYDNYKRFYQPDVIESKQLAHNGAEYDIFLRLYKKEVLTVVLNTEYAVQYGLLDSQHMYVTSRSTRIAEVADPRRSLTEEEPSGGGTGFLWRLNSYWRFEEADGGVYGQCRAISLSRDVPLGLGWMIKGFIEKFPKESMRNTLLGTKAAVERQSSSDSAQVRR
jgi:hypothetical protein